MKKLFSIINLGFFYLSLIAIFNLVFMPIALAEYTDNNVNLKPTTDCPSGNCLKNPLGDKMTDPNIVIGKIINSVLGVVGTIALAMFIYGGLRWMTSAGEKDGVTAGKETIKWATFGLIIIFMAYAIINFVLKDILMQV